MSSVSIQQCLTATVRNLVYTPVKDRAARHTAATHSVPECVHQKENVSHNFFDEICFVISTFVLIHSESNNEINNEVIDERPKLSQSTTG